MTSLRWGGIFRVIVFFLSIILSGCFFPIPTSETDSSRVYKTFEAYGYTWRYFEEVIARNYFTLDSDLFEYIKFDVTVATQDGSLSVLVRDSVYVKQQDASYKKLQIPEGPINNISIDSLNDKIYITLTSKREPITDCFAYLDDPNNIENPKMRYDFWGELDVKEGKFYITHFLPFLGVVKSERNLFGLSKGQLVEERSKWATNLICETEPDMTKVRDDFNMAIRKLKL